MLKLQSNIYFAFQDSTFSGEICAFRIITDDWKEQKKYRYGNKNLPKEFKKLLPLTKDGYSHACENLDLPKLPEGWLKVTSGAYTYVIRDKFTGRIIGFSLNPKAK